MEIVKMHTETLPPLRLIGKRCLCHPKDFTAKWSEWFDNGWFDQLKKLGAAKENEDAYWGATQFNCYWIGLLFQPGTPVPDGFECAEIPAGKYAVFGFAGKNEGELFGEDGIHLVLEELRKRGLAPLEAAWGLEWYICPPSAPADNKGKVLLEFRISIHEQVLAPANKG